RGVDTPRLDGHDGIDLSAQFLFELTQRLNIGCPTRYLFVDDGGSAHGQYVRRQRVVGEITWINDIDLMPFAEDLFQHQFADIRVATAAGPEKRGAPDEAVEIVLVDFHRVSPHFARSPTAFTRTRTA